MLCYNVLVQIVDKLCYITYVMVCYVTYAMLFYVIMYVVL